MQFSFSQVVSVLLALSPILVPVMVIVYQYIAAHIQPALKQHPVLMQLVDSVVTGVEQEFAGAQGAEKKQAALTMLVELCKHYGISIDPSLLSVLIESYVYQMKQYQGFSSLKPAEPAPTSQEQIPTQAQG